METAVIRDKNNLKNPSLTKAQCHIFKQMTVHIKMIIFIIGVTVVFVIMSNCR